MQDSLSKIAYHGIMVRGFPKSHNISKAIDKKPQVLNLSLSLKQRVSGC